MNFKSYIIEKNYSQIEKTRSILFYGENKGLKNLFIKLIKIIKKQTMMFTFLQYEILHNANLLYNELSNLSLFEEKNYFHRKYK